MKVGDKVLVNDDIYIEPIFARHGIVNKVVSGKEFEVLFVDGVVENYWPHECTILSDKEWFKLQLRG